MLFRETYSECNSHKINCQFVCQYGTAHAYYNNGGKKVTYFLCSNYKLQE